MANQRLITDSKKRVWCGKTAFPPPFQQTGASAPLGIKDVDADPDLMEENGIRTIQVMLEYYLGGKTQIKKVRLKSGGTLSVNVPVVLPLDSEEVFYSYSLVTNSGEKFVQQERLPVIPLSLDEITNIPE